MSGIAGIFHPDGRPVDVEDLHAMTESMAHRGPDGIGHWTGPSVGLGHCLFRTTPEQIVRTQPLLDQREELCLTLDGRVDNREELRAALGPLRDRLRYDTDAELVLGAYLRWGEKALPRIVGDFAFAVWDSRRRTLFAARDIRGKRPFYYHHGPGLFRFASEPQAVLADRRVPRQVNEGMVAEYLTGEVRSRSETLYRHLSRLPPAHVLSVSARGLTISRYWGWDPDRHLRLGSDDEYAEAFLEVFEQAVRACLRASGPVAVDLSGGVDSSSVAATAVSLRRRGQVDVPIEVVSPVYPGWRCDEEPYIDAVARQLGIETRKVLPVITGAEVYEAETMLYRDLHGSPIGSSVHLLTRASDIRVRLTGMGGDEWLSGSHYGLADLLRRGQAAAALGWLDRTRSNDGTLAAGRELWHFGLRPLTPPRLRRRVGQVAGRTVVPPWVSPSWSRRHGLDDRLAHPILTTGSHADRHLAAWLDAGWSAHVYEAAERSTAWLGHELRHPLDDRRVIELALALPEDQRLRDGTTKWVLRRAMAERLPELVRCRKSKAELSRTYYEDIRAQGGGALYSDLVLEKLGWVDGPAVTAMYDDMATAFGPGGSEISRHTTSLWMVLAVDRWLRLAGRPQMR